MAHNAPTPDPSTRSDILGVVVVYGRSLEEVEAWPVLAALLGDDGPDDGPRLRHMLIYDNSPHPRIANAGELARCTYVHDAGNGGTAAAYVRAAKLATELGLPWLLLLDHDTRLPADFISATRDAFAQAVTNADVAALVPRVQHRQGAIISPVLVTRYGTMLPLQPGRTPPPGAHMSAIASGTFLRLSALTSLLPLPQELWLDYVDHWIFAELHRRGLSSIVFESVLQHDLSIVAPGELSPDRLDSVLRGEARFHGLLGPIARLVYPWRIAWRLVRLGAINPSLALHALRTVVLRRRVWS